MIALCAHCLAAGWTDRAFLGERAPLDDPRVTHGCCDFHVRQYYIELAALRRRKEGASA